MKVGTKVKSTWVNDASFGHEGIMLGLHPKFNQPGHQWYGVRFHSFSKPGLGHICNGMCEDKGWWIHVDNLEVLEMASMMSDPLFTLEEITEW
jgi:hypothetical protein